MDGPEPAQEQTAVYQEDIDHTGPVRHGPFGIGSALLLLTTLAACSQSSVPDPGALPAADSANDPAPTQGGQVEPELWPPSESEAGWWVGTISRDGEIAQQADCLVTGAGDLACELYPATYSPRVFRDDPVPGVVYAPAAVIGGARGTLHLAAPEQPTGSGKLYAAPDQVLSDGTSQIAEFTIVDGSLSNDKRHLEFMFDSLGKISTFSGVFDPYYYDDSVLTRPSEGIFVVVATGVYTEFNLFGDPASLSIDPDGAFFSQSATGCVFSGQVAIIDPGYNGFTVDGTVGNCSSLNGTYAGFAYMEDYAWANGYDALKILVFKSDGFIAAEVRNYY